MLLPALNKAREAAKSISCLSNLRQLGIVFSIYAEQSNNFYPPYGDGAPPSNPPTKWAGRLWEMRLLQTVKILQCPSFTEFNYPDFGVVSSSTPMTAGLWSYVQYGYNHYNLGSSLRVTTNPGLMYIPAKRNQVRNSTQTILLTDSIRGGMPGVIAGYYVVNDVMSTNFIPDARHNGSVNVLWCDGHATSIRAKDRENPYPQLGYFNYSVPGSTNWWDRE
jgi:prepilin-type processing-associated H-X9-DG protein